MSASLLPKHVQSFADSGYWRDFFKKRGEKAFEWYGSYAEIGNSLERYLKPTDRILQIGCGNSTLADDLYDNGFRRVVSIDIVEDVIKRQTDKNTSIRPELEFHIADVTRTNDDGNGPLQSTYQAVLDKGTLDALLPPGCDEKQESAVKSMFERVDRMLGVGGRYLVITLAQPEIVFLWMSSFQNGENRSFILRVHQLTSGSISDSGDDQWKLPTFLLVATKLKPMGDGKIMPQMLEFFGPNKDSTPQRFAKPIELLEMVKAAQEYAIFCDKAKAGDLHEELRIELHSSGSTNTARYTIFLTTPLDRKKKFAHAYAIFVVPQGREHEWLFSTPKGRRELCGQAAARRLAVVHLGRDHDFPNLEAVKKELNERVMDFAPSDVASSGRQVPYLSLGDDIGQRTVVFRGESDISGKFVVEDVTETDGKNQTVMRRLVFMQSQNLIQSQAKLHSRRGSKKGGQQTSIDWSYLDCAHHRIMLAALAVPENKESISVCLLGLGGGCLATFIWKYFPEVRMTVVELDPAIVETAAQFFDFPKSTGDQRMNCVVGDGVEFVRTMLEANNQFDVVLLDVAGPSHVDGMSCPLPAFVEDEFLKRLHAILRPNGVLAFNLVSRDSEKKSEVQSSINRYFSHVFRQAVEGELNEVLLCFCEPRDPEWTSKYQKRLQTAFARLSKTCNGFKGLKSSDSSTIENLLDRLANL